MSVPCGTAALFIFARLIYHPMRDAVESIVSAIEYYNRVPRRRFCVANRGGLEQRVLDQEILRSLRTLRLCSQIRLAASLVTVALGLCGEEPITGRMVAL